MSRWMLEMHCIWIEKTILGKPLKEKNKGWVIFLGVRLPSTAKWKCLPFPQMRWNYLDTATASMAIVTSFCLNSRKNERKKVQWVDSRVGVGFISGCDSQRAPKWEGVLMKLLLCAKPLIGMFLLKPYITPVGAKCLSFKLSKEEGYRYIFSSQWNLCIHKDQMKMILQVCRDLHRQLGPPPHLL